MSTAQASPFAATTEPARLAAWAELAAAGPLVRGVLPNGVPAWFITDHALCKEALTADDRFHKTGTANTVILAKHRPDLLPAIGSHMLVNDGPVHARLRRLVNAAFTRRPMEALDGRIHELTDELIDALRAHGPDEVVDLIEHFAFPLPMTVICDMLGLPLEHRAEFREHIAIFNQGIFAGEERFVAAVDRMVALLREVVEGKRREPREDLLTALVAARDGSDRLSEDELTSMIIVLVIAGHETTVSLLAGGLAALFAHPDQLARLREDPTLISGAVEELLRWTSPVQVTFPLAAIKDTELGGVPIAAGETLIPSLLAANRLAAAEADELDLTRSPNHHVAFGHGAHHCLGAPLARLEARIALLSLLDAFPDLSLAVPVEQLAFTQSFLFNALAELPVRLGKPRTT